MIRENPVHIAKDRITEMDKKKTRKIINFTALYL